MGMYERAAERLKKGGMVVIYDGDEREGEADLIIHAQNARPETIETLRKDAGGLICLALDKAVAERLGLPFYTDILAASKHPIARMECKKTAYGDAPAFAIPVNHKGVYTGITDNDRSLTITKLAELARDVDSAPNAKSHFMEEFYSPGHVFLLIGRGIEKRHGHTELSLELAGMAGLPGAMVLCEMLGKGNALPKEKAKAYAKRNGLIFIEGKDIIGRRRE
ncbi:3,4-dihydroxy-2-butanone-4-phosphate synthase [Candidatus Micrarchaeota archaeon]|nr:3,4-dihydroxy-2-butanone-4-phosphate synthase [Candidatus Micrarchaeota archaeon]